MDLQFPHHENEIAQSEGATGETFVNVWMHNGFVRVDNEKMSKSLGNFFTVREVLKQYQPEVIRFFILLSHYRSPLNYSDEQLNDAKAGLTRLYTALRNVEAVDTPLEGDYKNRFEQAMDDDFNTPVALSVLFDIATELNKAKQQSQIQKIKDLANNLRKLSGYLGLLQLNPDEFFKSRITHVNIVESVGVSDSYTATVTSNPDAWIEREIQKRLDFKKFKHWDLADQIRDELKQQGVILEDKPDGTTSWRRE
jgi:cysteinyl-tRNA synthetase